MKIEVRKSLNPFELKYIVTISEIPDGVSHDQLKTLIQNAANEAMKALKMKYEHSSGNINKE